MGKNRKVFTCTSCGTEYPKWQGKCFVCDEWNTIVESTLKQSQKRKTETKSELIPLGSVESNTVARIQTGIKEFNLVCGGGLVPGSVILIGGEPGIGKSTLALQIAGFLKTLYISGEESPIQLRHRADRLKIKHELVTISTETDVESIIGSVQSEKPECLIIDSIQTLFSSDIPGLRGSISQIREATARLIDLARETNTVVLLIGHITKEGSIAGPKILEHLVDTVLYFEGNFTSEFRVLRAFKNRYGSINEIGLFRMDKSGLIEVTDKNSIFLNPYTSSSPGNAVSAAIEGSRIILFEVQSLVNFSSLPNPRRMSDGFDLNRLILIIAVLEKHAGLKLGTFDVFINVSGGFQISETSADLSVAVSIASSLKNQSIPEGVGFLGEVSLSGELRPVSQVHRRVQEFKHAGFNSLIVPGVSVKEAKSTEFNGEIIGVQDIQAAIDRLF